MTQELELGIAHLDFPVEEKEPKKEPIHWAHPIDVDKYWCGAPANRIYSFTGPVYGKPVIGRPPEQVTCVGCLHEYISKGSDWWWGVHCAYYQSTCSMLGHNCGH